MNNNLSYILSTYNKLAYLKVTIPILIDSLDEDDELIVIDGDSQDGTKEYLGKLYQENKKFSFISEKDKGEAHGFNKGVLLANCDLIKIITDDDAFNYPVIKKCKDFMALHPEIDIMAGNTGGIRVENIKTLYIFHSNASGIPGHDINFRMKSHKIFAFFNNRIIESIIVCNYFDKVTISQQYPFIKPMGFTFIFFGYKREFFVLLV